MHTATFVVTLDSITKVKSQNCSNNTEQIQGISDWCTSQDKNLVPRIQFSLQKAPSQMFLGFWLSLWKPFY